MSGRCETCGGVGCDCAATDAQSVDRLYSRRDYWYGRSRANRWPLWVSWLLAPTKHARQTCRELIQLKRQGFDV